MNSYECLRERWFAGLEENGEVARLNDDSRELLERGSLEVLLSTRFTRFDRHVGVVRSLAGVALFTLLLAAAATLGLPIAPLPASSFLPALAACAALFALAFFVTRDIERRRDVYRELLAARRELYSTLAD